MTSLSITSTDRISNEVVGDVVEFHPLASLFPLMERPDLSDLVADIKTNGLIEPIVVFEDKILDGRNRYLACVEAGVAPICRSLDGGDPLALVISLNIRRRHLTQEQKRELIAKLLRVQPEKSDREIAKTTKVDHKTVGATRRALGNWGNSPVEEDHRSGRQGPQA